MYTARGKGVDDCQPKREAKTAATLAALQSQLHELVPTARATIVNSDRLEDIIPLPDRRVAWQALRAAGFPLPALRLSWRVLMISVAIVLGPVLLMALAWQRASICLAVVELGILAYRLTRPLATHAPASCETVREAVLHLTPFEIADYRAGLWPREDVRDKVRLIIARGSGVRFQDVFDDSRLICGLPRSTAGTGSHRAVSDVADSATQ